MLREESLLLTLKDCSNGILGNRVSHGRVVRSLDQKHRECQGTF